MLSSRANPANCCHLPGSRRLSTANSQAARCSVAESTVVRVAISLGFESYREFRRVSRSM
ncbi:hypothetical protein CFBP5877_27330 (plasmid) [Agrobacterium tumefaciens]|uniref:HTH rpiR-type domain-containing protein n=1 Tax=Agrobacterium tumefaciens TaxID=358 RepID=A0AAE6EIM7_AGRTU|nr:hypothetical protein CFBP5499_28080 [Agrobacterium tumefaciens]QCL82881.1 hypothetical protein CFBP5877_27330 [Agrobacterium tumefaciens]